MSTEQSPPCACHIFRRERRRQPWKSGLSTETANWPTPGTRRSRTRSTRGDTGRREKHAGGLIGSWSAGIPSGYFGRSDLMFSRCKPREVWKGLITVEKHLETHIKSPAVVGDFIAPHQFDQRQQPAV